MTRSRTAVRRERRNRPVPAAIRRTRPVAGPVRARLREDVGCMGQAIEGSRRIPWNGRETISYGVVSSNRYVGPVRIAPWFRLLQLLTLSVAFFTKHDPAEAPERVTPFQ